MQEKIIEVDYSQLFIESLMKSSLLKEKFNLTKNPLLFVLFTNYNELSNYMEQKGFNIENLTKYYGLEKLMENPSLTLKNFYTENQINMIVGDFITKDYVFNQVCNGYKLTCKDILIQTYLEDNDLRIIFDFISLKDFIAI